MQTQQRTLVPARETNPKNVGELLSRDDFVVSRLDAVAGRYLPADRALRLAVMAVRKTPLLAQCDPASFMGALMTATGLGVEPNTAKQHAFLIPYKQSRPKRVNGIIQKDNNNKWLWEEYYECQFQMGYKGYVALMYRSESVLSLNADEVREGDVFKNIKGTQTYLEYSKTLGARGELLGAFCHTALKEGGQSFTVLPAEEIYALRNRSQTFCTLYDALEKAKQEGNERNIAKAQKKYDETPWVAWEGAMFIKSAIRQHAKYMELGTEDSTKLHVAADMDALTETGTFDVRQMADPDLAREVMRGDANPADHLDPQEEDEDDDDAPAASGGTANAPAQQEQQQDSGGSITGAATPAGAPRQTAAPRRSAPPSPPAVDTQEEVEENEPTPPSQTTAPAAATAAAPATAAPAPPAGAAAPAPAKGRAAELDFC